VENVPKKGGFIIAPNHRSNYDPPLVGCCIASRPVFFLAKKGLFINRLVSWILMTVHAIPVDTENPGVKTMRIFVELLKKGKAVIIFPEGSRSKTNEFLPPRPGVGYLSIRNNVPVVPVLITGTHESMLNHFLRKTPFTLKFGRPIYPDSGRANSKNAIEFTEKIVERIKGLA
ncbi:MAG: lysophospholipid acyltransferase family protein, partial [candidate division WOR-3 bacterium]